MADYWRCPASVGALAREIIEAHHDHLKDAKILFLFRDEASKKAGKVVLGKASKVSAKENAIAGAAPGMAYAFKIELAFDVWEDRGEAFHRALLDHELCHCGRERTDEGFKWVLLAHDVEEFACIVERHGAWKADLRQFLKTTGQFDLFGGAAAPGGDGAEIPEQDVAEAAAEG